MSLLEEGLGLSACPNALSSRAMGAQLQLLQALVPLHGWLVATLRNTHVTVAACSGAFHSLHAPLLEDILALVPLGRVSAAGVSGQRVPLSGAQLALLGATYSDSAWILFPLTDDAGQSLGFLAGLAPAAYPDQTLCNTYAAQCAQAVSAVLLLGAQLGSVHEHARRAQRRAVTDSLTGVYNRSGWMSKLARLDDTAALPGHDVGILMLDLDYLKVINDTQGHVAGDDLLCRTARVIQSVVRHEDHVGRLGGDEFGVLVARATPQVLDALVQRMVGAMGRAGISISMGFALRSEADSLKRVMHLADQRMYDHKRTKPEPEGLEASRRKRGIVPESTPSAPQSR